MQTWRMSFRVGAKGEELWPECHRRRVAAIEYTSMIDVDLSRYEEGEPRSAWSQLAPSQSASLRRFVYEMNEGDVIYAKQGPKIVGQGVVESDYEFDKSTSLRAFDGTPWQHQRRVEWTPGYPELTLQAGKQQVVALVPLEVEDVADIEQAVTKCFADESAMEGTKTEVIQIQRERNQKIRDLAFKAGNNRCCVCDRDFSQLLDGRGVRVLQVHHRSQLAASDQPTRTKVSDLAVVCANCHLLLHLDPKNALSIEDLRKLLQADGFLSQSK